jgi:hypothetical protein
VAVGHKVPPPNELCFDLDTLQRDADAAS